MKHLRAFELSNGDIFSVSLNTFISDSRLWSNPFHIMGFEKRPRKWWQFWKPQYVLFVRILFNKG